MATDSEPVADQSALSHEQQRTPSPTATLNATSNSPLAPPSPVSDSDKENHPPISEYQWTPAGIYITRSRASATTPPAPSTPTVQDLAAAQDLVTLENALTITNKSLAELKEMLRLNTEGNEGGSAKQLELRRQCRTVEVDLRELSDISKVVEGHLEVWLRPGADLDELL